uniref:Uncharacterized protein TCIL3000_4_600 n=1 Tax=Trypanosoma congolense (strain IL3000) TaxID=1068625 RepID=G0UKS1_TRYCI|nr:unnamed protein product [Trypanosoma congolense IL3000]
MSSHKLSAAAVSTRNRQQYLHHLRVCAREASRACEQSSEEIGASFLCGRGKLIGDAKAKFLGTNLQLPEGWVDTVTRRLQSSLDIFVPREKISGSDIFRCALIHPSYVRSRSARAAVAMPIELTLTGSSTLRLLREVAKTHGLVDRLGAQEVSRIPHKLGVADLVLFDKHLFDMTGETREEEEELPEEVCMAAATALCGAVVLTEGLNSAAVLLDRIHEMRG